MARSRATRPVSGLHLCKTTVSMSLGDPAVKQELKWDTYFTKPGVVYFVASGDSGIGVSIYPGASPNVVSVGGKYFNRDHNGDRNRLCPPPHP